MKRIFAIIVCTFGAVFLMGASGKPQPPPPPETARQMIMMDWQGSELPSIYYEGDGMLINVQLSEVELATLKIIGSADQQSINATLMNKLQTKINELKGVLSNE